MTLVKGLCVFDQAFSTLCATEIPRCMGDMLNWRSSRRKNAIDYSDHGFMDTLFSWSLENISNEDLYRDKVKQIDMRFSSIEHYFGSYVYPLLEETRTQLCSSMEILSSAPFAEVISLKELYSTDKKLYGVKTGIWKNRFSNHGKELYKTLSGDVFLLADFKPETSNDLQRVGRMWTFVLSAGIPEQELEEDTDIVSSFKFTASKDIDVDELREKSLFMVFLTNIIPNRRIWKALHMSRNSNLIKKILCASDVVEEICDYCSSEIDDLRNDTTYESLLSELNESQYKAICACLSSSHCNHKATVDLIWGPPGTGKTKTLGTLLFALWKMNFRILVCAPTNIAIKEVASRFLSIVRESFDGKSDDVFCSLGDMLLFGNHERLKVGADIEDIYLDYRVKQLLTCVDWKYCFASMIDLLENCVSSYHIFLENELLKEQGHVDDKSTDETKDGNSSDCSEGTQKSFLEFMRERFLSLATALRNRISILCTHVARSYILEYNLENLGCLIELLDSFEDLLFQNNINSEVLEEILSPSDMCHSSSGPFMRDESLLYKNRTECLSSLRTLKSSLDVLNLPNFSIETSIREFCFQTSSIIFSTASSSSKLHSVAMEPLNILVIDEAAQLKECESTIPLQLHGINHAILVGDECQLPAMVESKISYEAGFGRSLFGRLSSLGHQNHFLNIQYRMHPAISYFPNTHFYLNQILDAPNVGRKNYRKKYLPGSMFGPYSFINIVGGREEFDDAGRSRKNMVEVAIVMKILKNCFQGWLDSKENVSIGIVSPYAAQVVAIQDMLGQKYNKHDGFYVNVKTIDGFQGGEQDIIILSTVRTNGGTLQFISCPQRTNVALTRARHCLWILGSERALASQDNVWKALVLDAKKRQCFFDADENEELAKTIWDVRKELDQFDDLLNADSLLFRNSIWKVLFSDNFLKSFKKLRSKRTKKSVISLLLKLSSGWRPKRMKVDVLCGNSSQMLKQFKVEGLYVICSTDIEKESRYMQVLKIWDVLPPEDIPKLVRRLDNIFGSYSDDFVSRCNEKYFEGKIEIPMSWEKSIEIIRFKNLDTSVNDAELGPQGDQRLYIENSNVEESLLLMKFYSLSSVVVNHLLSDCDNNELDLPFEVTDEEREIILFPKSTFVLGRSGTGKTTVLTMKLFQKEDLHHKSVEAAYATTSSAVPCLNQDYKESSSVNDRPVLRQLFVTVSPKLCQAVKYHVVRLKRSICGGNVSAERNPMDEDIDVNALQFKNIADSFIDLPTDAYPLVITFQKFLLMLDGTLGNSFFGRFSNLDSNSQNLGVSSVALETFIRNKEVTYDRFAALYWPHFNLQHTKKLDCSRVFIEIISHIKGGIQAMEPGEGKLSRNDYLLLSENRASSLTKQKREMIYDVYLSYEKLKLDKGEFDMADIVVDLHRRLRSKRYEGDEMHFVYIDEVQDLTMSQIALFRYVCQNVEEGFVFSGDTAQTIARGIDFRFQDIKSLFYKKFVLESRRNTYNYGKEKISDIFLLNQNFRTHAGVLKLSQSTIELLFRFFPYSIDVLKPETSLIFGEAPVVLECGNKENAIVTIFGNSGHMTGKIVGFGAEQVILVRDDFVRREVLDYVGKQALVLTILECKGLEFQDVLLYNFFGSSPLKNQWRVVYEYMKEQDMLEPKELKAYPSFNESKHNILCSELKQLYVAITRTRQRLWICENTEEFSRPMFDYWKKKCLVQFKELDDSLAQAMKVASSPEEWKSRGIKLYNQNNYEMATMCFERAGDSYWEKKSKAAGLRATANRLRDLNPEDAHEILRQAAEIFEGIGMIDTAAQCFSDLGDHEKAGKLYLEKCEEPDFKRAGDCFYLAGCCEMAAQVYAKGKFFSDCLSVCAKGGLFDLGLYYIQHWKHNESAGPIMARSHELYTMEQKFLESCAHHYYDRKDTRSMMKFVRAFDSIESKREFLRSLSLLTELLLLEEELGNFAEAADIAKMMGDILCEADLLAKACKFVEAYERILFYVVANSLWSSGSKGWPLKQFAEKVELLNRALSFAKETSSSFHERASTEAEILSREDSNIFKIMIHLKSSRMHGSIRGEILCLWKLLDVHFQMNTSKYFWKNNVFDDSVEGMIVKNQLSVETLFYCWTSWKDNILRVLEYLPSFKCQEIQQHNSYGLFALDYLGVQKQNDMYLLLVPDANWVIKLGDKFLKKNGRLVSVDVHALVSAAESYWCSELFSVGMDVLHNLDALYKYSVNKVISEFCQLRCLMLIYDVANFLCKSKCFSCSHGYMKTLEKFSRYPIDVFPRYIALLNGKLLTKDMFSLKETGTYRDLVEKVVFENLKQYRLTYGQIGRVVVMILGTPKFNRELFVEIVTKWEGNLPWQEFIKSLYRNSTKESSKFNEASEELLHMRKFYEAVQYTYHVNWEIEIDYISPGCFIYLTEHLFLLASRWRGLVVATKSSLVEWLIYQEGNSPKDLSSKDGVPQIVEDVHRFIYKVIRVLLSEPITVKKWIRKSNMNVDHYYPLFVLRLVVLLCLLHLSSGLYLDLLHDLFRKNSSISAQCAHLPREFLDVLRKGKNSLGLKVYAEAFKVIDDPLVIVNLRKNASKFVSPDATIIDLMTCQKQELMLKVLLEKQVDDTAAVITEASDTKSNVFPSTNCSDLPNRSSVLVSDQPSNSGGIRHNESMNVLGFWDVLEKLQLAVDESCMVKVSHYSILIQENFLDPCIELLISSIWGSLPKNPVNLENKNEMGEVLSLLDELKQLSSSLIATDLKNQLPVIGELSKKILSRQPKVSHILDQLFLLCEKKVVVDYGVASEASTAALDNHDLGQSALEESKDKMSKNSPVNINSGSGNTKGNGKGKKNNSKKKKGGRKGK
ncbi:hypothetical protein AHAS_Ahas03G0374200 [Arachis hypogaea]